MKARLVITGIAFFFATALVCESAMLLPQTQDPPPQEGASATATKPAGQRARRGGRRRNTAQAGVPKGVQGCLDLLTKLASTSPLPDYEGRPSEIINNGLLWNDEKSRCSIGSDQTVRRMVFDLSSAWRMKNGDEVNSLLTKIKSAAPQS